MERRPKENPGVKNSDMSDWNRPRVGILYTSGLIPERQIANLLNRIMLRGQFPETSKVSTARAGTGEAAIPFG